MFSILHRAVYIIDTPNRGNRSVSVMDLPYVRQSTSLLTWSACH